MSNLTSKLFATSNQNIHQQRTISPKLTETLLSTPPNTRRNIKFTSNRSAKHLFADLHATSTRICTNTITDATSCFVSCFLLCRSFYYSGCLTGRSGKTMFRIGVKFPCNGLNQIYKVSAQNPRRDVCFPSPQTPPECNQFSIPTSNLGLFCPRIRPESGVSHCLDRERVAKMRSPLRG